MMWCRSTGQSMATSLLQAAILGAGSRTLRTASTVKSATTPPATNATGVSSSGTQATRSQR